MPPKASGPMARLSSSELKYLAMLAGVGISTTGRVYWVKAADDADYAEFSALVPKGRLFNDINLALAACRDFTNDYVIVCPQDAATGWVLTAALSMTKDTTHLIGVGSKVVITNTATSVLTIADGASRCEVANLHLEGIGNTCQLGLNTGTGAGHLIRDCRIFATAAGTGALADISVGGQDIEVRNCVLGTRTTHAAASNAAVAATGHHAIFTECKFLHAAAAAGDEFVAITTGADAPIIFDRCFGLNQNVAGQVMTVAITSPDANGIVAIDCAWVGATTCAATGKGLVSPAASGNDVLAATVYDPALSVNAVSPIAAAT